MIAFRGTAAEQQRSVLVPDDFTRNIFKFVAEKEGKEQEIINRYSGKSNFDWSVYTAYGKPALRFLRVILEDYYHKNFNVRINNIGSSLLEGAGILLPQHSIQLYEVVDSDYRYNYVLSGSLAMIEHWAVFFNNIKESVYEDYMFFENGYDINSIKLFNFTSALCKHFFGYYLKMEDLVATSKIIPLKINDVDFFVDTTKEAVSDLISNSAVGNVNRRIGVVLLTNRQY